MKSSVKFIFIALLLFSCSNDNGEREDETDSFDREAMLINWADNIIIPSFQAFSTVTQDLQEKTSQFTTDPTQSNLLALREAYEESYLQFQNVSLFGIGKAENVNFRARLNTYPTDAATISNKIQANNFNLELPSSFDEQGFPAIDFMINGLAGTNAEILSFYTTNQNASVYKGYLNALSERIDLLTNEVLSDWTTSYRDNFISNTSSGSTGAVDKFTNQYIMYYEKYLRSGKIGIPAGAFTGDPVPGNVESFYSSSLSKNLYLKSLESVQNFFNGKHFNSSQKGLSYNDYLEFINTNKNGQDLNSLINGQFNSIRTQATNLDQDFVSQIQSNNSVMLSAFDELQRNVVYLKVDMMQALSISVDYVDSDGD